MAGSIKSSILPLQAIIGCILPLFFTVTAYDEDFVQFLLSQRPALTDGLSLNGTSLHQLRFTRTTNHKVRAILNVENWSRFTLLDSQTDIHCGSVLPRYQATNVYPGYREVMLGVGTEIFGGTCGTISWQIVELSVRLIVMWSVPFNLNLYDTYLGLAMIYNQGPFSSSSYWFNKMYYSNIGPHVRGLGGKILMYENSHLTIYGYIEAWTYHPMLNISVIPQRKYNLAPGVINKLYNTKDAKVASVTSMADTSRIALTILTILVILSSTL